MHCCQTNKSRNVAITTERREYVKGKSTLTGTLRIMPGVEYRMPSACDLNKTRESELYVGTQRCLREWLTSVWDFL
jgi:hypothetical protein